MSYYRRFDCNKDVIITIGVSRITRTSVTTAYFTTYITPCSIELCSTKKSYTQWVNIDDSIVQLDVSITIDVLQTTRITDFIVCITTYITPCSFDPCSIKETIHTTIYYRWFDRKQGYKQHYWGFMDHPNHCHHRLHYHLYYTLQHRFMLNKRVSIQLWDIIDGPIVY